MAPGASRRIRYAWLTALAAVLSLLALSLVHALPAGRVSAGPATLPDLTITIVDSADPVAANQKYSYTTTVSNTGGSTAGTEIDPITSNVVGVRTRENMPMGWVTNSFSATGRGVCQLAPPSPIEVLTCQFAPFVPGQVETIVVSGAILPGGLPQVASPVLVDLPISQVHESNEVSNNVDVESTDVLQPTSTPTATATVTPTSTPTHTPTVTRTATPTRTRVPPELGGVAAYPNASPGANFVLIASGAGAALAVLLMGGALTCRRRTANG